MVSVWYFRGVGMVLDLYGVGLVLDWSGVGMVLVL